MIYESSFLTPRIHFRRFLFRPQSPFILTTGHLNTNIHLRLHTRAFTCLTHTHTHTHRFMTTANPQPGLIAVTADIARQRRVISSAVVYEWMLIRPPPTPLMSFSSLPHEKRPEKALSIHLFCSLPWDSLCVTYIRFHSATGEITSKSQTKRKYVKDEDIPGRRKRQNKKLVRAKMSADPLAVDWIKVLL